MPYDPIDTDDWFLAPREMKLQCCDCGLVHRFELKVKDGRLLMRVLSEPKATAQVRRHQPTWQLNEQINRLSSQVHQRIERARRKAIARSRNAAPQGAYKVSPR